MSPLSPSPLSSVHACARPRTCPAVPRGVDRLPVRRGWQAHDDMENLAGCRRAYQWEGGCDCAAGADAAMGRRPVALEGEVAGRGANEGDAHGLQRLVEQLVAERTQQLEAALVRERGFSHSVAHDLRGP